MSVVAGNIKYLRKLHQWTQGEFAEKIHIKRSLVGAYEEGRADPRLNNLLNMAKVFGVSVDLMITKDLEGKTLEQIQAMDKKSGGAMKVLSITVNDKDNEYIDLIPQKASAGYLNGYADPQYLEELPKFQIPSLPTSGTYRAFEITGDSMLPIKPGTIVIGQYLDSLSSIKNGRCYIILSKEEGVVYKRVFDYTDELGQLFLVSDNKAYSPYKIEASDVIEIWEAKAYLSMEIPEYSEDDMSFEKLKNIVLELQQEVIKMKG
ncbi:LexA family transcriptional regulator [Roseivirga sp. UBA838]|uniref:LexA family transcriptional regulator n=1 Tax=Roseivirga sp. UBA838 TaxID=1947393 RepID=UPI00257F3E58|nr:LexA family transcriptional regulator [Roseivirga sp. UBA838]|tara:strand:- start:21605 stop:22390 length:786 start_codon:yes stop_codon:yes gene_type:complete